MAGFVSTFLASLSIVLPTILLIYAAAWLILARLGRLRTDRPWNAADLRTWKLPYVMAEGTIFAVAFAAAMAAVGETSAAEALAGGFASILMLGLGPLLPAYLKT